MSTVLSPVLPGEAQNKAVDMRGGSRPGSVPGAVSWVQERRGMLGESNMGLFSYRQKSLKHEDANAGDIPEGHKQWAAFSRFTPFTPHLVLPFTHRRNQHRSRCGESRRSKTRRVLRADGGDEGGERCQGAQRVNDRE